MKLHQFKTKYLSTLTLYQPVNAREQYFVNILVRKIYMLRTKTLPDMLMLLNDIYEDTFVSLAFRNIVKGMIEDIKNIDSSKK